MSTTPPRNVIYCNDPNSLAGIARLPYTDVILNFLAPDGNGNLTGPIPNPADVQMLQNAGKNVLISLGGDNDTFPPSAWQQYATDVPGLVQQVAGFVTDNGLSGVDIDYEDGDNGFTGGPDGTGFYPGIQFLIDLTNGLARALPPGHNIITHAPQPPYFDPNGGYNNAYTQIFEAAGDNISWFNCQFYNNSSYDEPASTKVAWYGTIASTTSAPKLLVGAPVAADAADSGYLPLGQFASQVIAPLRQQYPGSFGGVTGWAFLYDQGGTWADGIGLALHQQHVFYPGSDRNVHHVYWDPAAGLSTDGLWTSDGPVAPGSTVATQLAGAQQHVFYTGADLNVHHVYWDPAAGLSTDGLWTSDGPVAPGSTVATQLAGAQQHVFYTGADLNVHHVYWDPVAGLSTDGLWTSDGQVSGDVATLLDGAQQHVFYIGTDGNVHHVYWDPAAGLSTDGLWTSGALVGSTVATMLDGAQQHVFYTGADFNVHHVYWDPVAGLSTDGLWTSGALVGSTVATMLDGAQQHVFYTGADFNVHHVYWDPAAGLSTDGLWTSDGQAEGDPAVLLDGAQQHVFYARPDLNLHHVYWDPATGINADQWTSDGQVGSDLATLLTG